MNGALEPRRKLGGSCITQGRNQQCGRTPLTPSSCDVDVLYPCGKFSYFPNVVHGKQKCMSPYVALDPSTLYVVSSGSVG